MSATPLDLPCIVASNFAYDPDLNPSWLRLQRTVGERTAAFFALALCQAAEADDCARHLAQLLTERGQAPACAADEALESLAHTLVAYPSAVPVSVLGHVRLHFDTDAVAALSHFASRLLAALRPAAAPLKPAGADSWPVSA